MNENRIDVSPFTYVYHFVTVLVCVFQKEDVASMGVEVGLPVFYVPMSEEFTRYVFVEQLRR